MKNTKVLILPSVDKGHEVCVMVPEEKTEYLDILAAIEEARSEHPNTWSWCDVEPKIEALGYTIPDWDQAGFYWDT